MTNTKPISKKMKAVKTVIKMAEKGVGRDKCKSYAVGCSNCQGQILLGCLDNFLNLLIWEKQSE